MEELDKLTVVVEVCELISAGNMDAARETARQSLPFEPIPNRAKRINRKSGLAQSLPPTAKRDVAIGKELQPKQSLASGSKRRVSEKKKLQVWQRDGFRCRYTKQRLVFPQTLELLSLLLPEELPYDNPPHGKYALTHVIMYELWPAIDHVKAISRSYDSVLANSPDNLVTASAPVNSEKSWNDLDFFRWPLLPPEPLPDWDGLTGWYVQYLNQDPSWFDHPTSGARLKGWYRRLS